MAETALYGPMRIAASEVGARLFRNHVGLGYQIVGKVPKGWRPPPWLAPYRFGLQEGSADLIGWAPVVVTPAMVGRTLAVFASVEAKTEDGRMSKEQTAWLNAVREAGGIACVARSVEACVAGLTLP